MTIILREAAEQDRFEAASTAVVEKSVGRKCAHFLAMAVCRDGKVVSKTMRFSAYVPLHFLFFRFFLPIYSTLLSVVASPQPSGTLLISLL